MNYKKILLLVFFVTGNVFANSCPLVKIVLLNDSAWKPSDVAVMERAKSRCKEIYSDMPCLKELRKIEDHRFFAVCGKDLNDLQDIKH